MGLRSTDKIFEVGCGCGAFLYNFYKDNHIVSGIDYSANLIKISKQIMSNMVFEEKEAIDMETRTKFDIVVSNSIFFYFKDYDYAKQVLRKMIHKSERVIGVFDIPNLRLKEESEKERRSLIKDYDKKYQGLQHLYYYKKWFLEIGEENELNISFYDQNIDNYNNNKYRFNVIMFKKDK